MNKIKVIYNAVRKMKDKEVFKGVLTAEALKDGQKIFGLNNAFEKNINSGRMKGQTNIEVDCDGKKMKLENNIDFEGKGCMGYGSHGFMKHFHPHHHFHNHHGAHNGGMKDGLSKITAILGILSSIKLDERDDKSVMLSLVSKDIPEDIRKGIQEHMRHGHEGHKHMHEQFKHKHETHEHHIFMKEFHDMEKAEFTINILISPDSEIEIATVELKGEKKDDNNECHDMELKADLNLKQ